MFTAEMDQFVYDTILGYLPTGQLPQELKKNQKDALRRHLAMSAIAFVCHLALAFLTSKQCVPTLLNAFNKEQWRCFQLCGLDGPIKYSVVRSLKYFVCVECQNLLLLQSG